MTYAILERRWKENPEVIEGLLTWLEKPGFGHFTIHAKDDRLLYGERVDTIHPRKEKETGAGS